MAGVSRYPTIRRSPEFPFPVESPAGVVLAGRCAAHQPRRRPSSMPPSSRHWVSPPPLAASQPGSDESSLTAGSAGALRFLDNPRYCLVLMRRAASLVRTKVEVAAWQITGGHIADFLGRSGRLRFNAAVTPSPAGGLQCFT